MSSDSRFYQLEFRNRPVFKGDIGSLLKIDGLILGGGGARVYLMLPSAEPAQGPIVVAHPSEEEWNDFLQRSDVPEILVGPPKAFHRKARFEISGLIQQR